MNSLLRRLRLPVTTLLIASLLSSCVLSQHTLHHRNKKDLGDPGIPTHAWENDDGYCFLVNYTVENEEKPRYITTDKQGTDPKLTSSPKTQRPLEIRIVTGPPFDPPAALHPENGYPFVVSVVSPKICPTTYLCTEYGKFEEIRIPFQQFTPSGRILLLPAAAAADIILTPYYLYTFSQPHLW